MYFWFLEVFIVIEVKKEEKEESDLDQEICVTCEKVILATDERPKKDLNFSVHAKCFHCALCQTSLELADFVRAGSLLCQPHYTQLTNMKNSKMNLRGDLAAMLEGKPEKVCYRMGVMTKPGVSYFPPYLTYPATYEKSDKFREFLLTKIINAERASMNATDFRTRSKRTRKVFLDSVLKKEIK